MEYAKKMADSDMKRNPEAWMIDFREKPKWEYTHGLMMNAYLALYEETKQDRYLEYVKAFADTMVQESGGILTYKLTDYNIDRVSPGRFLIRLYNLEPREKYWKAIRLLRSQMETHPRTLEGGFWHKKRYPHQMWLDGLYMGSPFLALYGKEFNEPQLFDDVVHQIMLINKHHYHPESGLFYHGWDESREQRWSDPETGLSPHFWGRAVGWYAMALVDVLEYLPENHPGRDSVLFVVDRLAAGIVKHQDSKTGVWYQVLDKGDCSGNYLESSASTMFAYFLYKSLNKGYLDESYIKAAARAYDGIIENFIKEEPDGTISITNVCAVAGLGGNPYRDGSYEYYVSEPVRKNDPKAVGPFIMAAIEKAHFEE
ncbi:glycoside hydrolase family 88/105 protein [Anaerophaga thermohalophila]|uniref:glycoside hydrolase family 88/105 protein n=1 Tax=Anaerophaga thermohalophila TaxID=177400 RepID=UPI0002DB65F5|nr:glycoside hydrolase family 88 protein [Anaerophaga thermohalophila]